MLFLNEGQQGRYSFCERAGRAQRPSETVWGKLWVPKGASKTIIFYKLFFMFDNLNIQLAYFVTAQKQCERMRQVHSTFLIAESRSNYKNAIQYP